MVLVVVLVGALGSEGRSGRYVQYQFSSWATSISVLHWLLLQGFLYGAGVVDGGCEDFVILSVVIKAMVD